MITEQSMGFQAAVSSHGADCNDLRLYLERRLVALPLLTGQIFISVATALNSTMGEGLISGTD
ncbi:MAG: hypothetical protein AAGA46_14195 [Cyanobacteria bacterium P01_F01_bin.13]